MILSCSNIWKSFDDTSILKQVSFHLEEHEKAAVVGINGAGKSTFLKVLAGTLEADAGSIARNPNIQVSVLSQNPVMEDGATVLEQVFLHFPAEFRALNEYEAKSMLNRLGLPDYIIQKAADRIVAGRVELNHRPCVKADRTVNEGDVMTCRGLGKCVLKEISGLSKKGRIMIVMERYL